MMAISLSIVSQPSNINARISRIIDSLVDKMSEIELLEDDFGAQFLFLQKSIIIDFEIHGLDDRLK